MSANKQNMLMVCMLCTAIVSAGCVMLKCYAALAFGLVMFIMMLLYAIYNVARLRQRGDILIQNYFDLAVTCASCIVMILLVLGMQLVDTSSIWPAIREITRTVIGNEV